MYLWYTIWKYTWSVIALAPPKKFKIQNSYLVCLWHKTAIVHYCEKGEKMTHLSPFFCAREQRSMYRYVCLATHPQPLSRVTKIPKKLGMPSLMSNNQSCQYFMGWTYLNAKNLAPFLPPTLWESKIFLGGFWHLSQLKFEEISPKLQRI